MWLGRVPPTFAGAVALGPPPLASIKQYKTF